MLKNIGCKDQCFLSNEERTLRTVNDVFETLGGPIYYGADPHFSNYFAKQGKDFDIEVAINNHGITL